MKESMKTEKQRISVKNDGYQRKWREIMAAKSGMKGVMAK